MNPSEEHLTSQDIMLLRSLLGRFGGSQLVQTTPAVAQPGSPTQPSPSALQPAESFTQSIPSAPVSNNLNGIQQPGRSSVMQPAQSFPQSMLSVPSANGGIPHLPNPAFPPHPGHPSVAPAITPYHSALPGAHGHPPPSTRISSAVENIGSGIASQVNQQRLSAAAVNLPPHLSLPQRTTRPRRRRGPAISPPTLTPMFSLNSVLSNEGSSSPLLRIKVKVYPPQASISLCLFDSSQLIDLDRKSKPST